eukprot:COSAG06_NODE_6577_length_2872_cov_5.690003_3_plen_77_part_00
MVKRSHLCINVLKRRAFVFCRWASFCAHFGASPDNGFNRAEFVRFDELRKGHTSEERWKRSHPLKALVNVQPGECA